MIEYVNDPLCKQEWDKFGHDLIQRMVMERNERHQIYVFVVIFVPGATCQMEREMNPKIEEIIEYIKDKRHRNEGYHCYSTNFM